VGFNGYPHGTIQYTDFLNSGVQSGSLGLILDTQLDVQNPSLLNGIE
jgi:hypothetical protein